MKVQKSKNLAELGLTYKSKVKACDREQVKSSREAYELLKSVYDADSVEHVESAVILLLNRSLHVLGWVKISTGGITSAIVDVRVIFQYALKANATAVILSHNHPSGNIQPSQEDKSLTKRLVEAGKLLEIQMFDHIIYTPDDYFSFGDEGMI
jgi:DNA repair protein RadC